MKARSSVEEWNKKRKTKNKKKERDAPAAFSFSSFSFHSNSFLFLRFSLFFSVEGSDLRNRCLLLYNHYFNYFILISRSSRIIGCTFFLLFIFLQFYYLFSIFIQKRKEIGEFRKINRIHSYCHELVLFPKIKDSASLIDSRFPVGKLVHLRTRLLSKGDF